MQESIMLGLRRQDSFRLTFKGVVMMKPRVNFCWHCMRRLWPGHFAEYHHPEDGHIRIVHKDCKADLENTGERISYGTSRMFEEEMTTDGNTQRIGYETK